MEEAVWAKLRYCPYWPAKIVEVPLGLKKQPRKFCVYFFGSNNYGFVDMDNTLSYLQHRTKYAKKWRGKLFTHAIALCDEFVNNPKDLSPPTQTQIVLAKEYEFEVKEEPKDDDLWYSNEVVQLQTTTPCTDCNEKQTLIDSLEAENKRLETELQRMKNELDGSSKKVVELQLALKRTESAHKIEIEETKLKLLQTNSNHEDECSDKCSDDELNDQYEVERLLNHKIQNGTQTFFVKWKGYNNRHNSWVKRSNLSCKKMLQKYLKDNGID